MLVGILILTFTSFVDRDDPVTETTQQIYILLGVCHLYWSAKRKKLNIHLRHFEQVKNAQSVFISYQQRTAQWSD